MCEIYLPSIMVNLFNHFCRHNFVPTFCTHFFGSFCTHFFGSFFVSSTNSFHRRRWRTTNNTPLNHLPLEQKQLSNHPTSTPTPDARQHISLQAALTPLANIDNTDDVHVSNPNKLRH